MSYPRINCDGTLAQIPAIIGLKPSFLYLKTPVSLKTPVFAYAFLWKSKKQDSHIRLGSSAKR
jgi:hypothetical protein